MTMLQKFTDDTMRLPCRGRDMLLHVHRTEFGGAVAVVADHGSVKGAASIPRGKVGIIRESVFGAAGLRGKRVPVAALRKQLGSIVWSKSAAQRPIIIENLHFDGVLVGRALAAMGARGTVEVSVAVLADTPLLRIVSPTSRATIAGCRPFEKAKRIKLAPSAPRQSSTGKR